MVLPTSSILIRIWVEFLIGQFILEVTFSIRLGPMRWVRTAHCAGRRGLYLLTAVSPVELAHYCDMVRTSLHGGFLPQLFGPAPLHTIKAHIHACTHFREKMGIFFFNRRNSRNQEKGDICEMQGHLFTNSGTKRSQITHYSILWRHNGRDCVSNHQPHDCLLNRLFRRRSKKTSKLRGTGLCAWNSPGTGGFSAQMASNAENVSIWWRHHGV